jgi:3-carboxy-cis,cis-muconate cycloisomerase
VVNNNPTAGRVADPGIRALFSRESRLQAWIDVEAALAVAQGELGIIPAAAAERIAEVADLALLDTDRMAESTRRTSHPLVPLVWELARVAGDEHGGWVHWGATTQNIVQTGDALVIRRAHAIFLDHLARILTSLADLAERGASMPIAGRTHGQHAVPATFGFKIAVWIDELERHVERLRQAEERVFVTMLGGAVGNYASMGEKGPVVQAGVARVLGLQPMAVPARTIGDHLAEYVGLLGLLAATTGKISREIYTLMKTEYGEVEEPMPDGTVGSSTMPQKRNPQLCQDMIAESTIVRVTVPLALEAMQMEHEADRSRGLMMQDAVERACVAMGEVLSRLVVVSGGLHVFPERMRSNLDLSHGLIMSEAVMLRLGEVVGRQTAHDIVYEAAQAAAQGRGSFADLLAADERVTSQIDTDISELLDPVAYTGLSAQLAHEAASRARQTADALSTHLASLVPPRTGRQGRAA